MHRDSTSVWTKRTCFVSACTPPNRRPACGGVQHFTEPHQYDIHTSRRLPSADRAENSLNGSFTK